MTRRKRNFLTQWTAEHPNVTVHGGDCNRVLVERVLPRCRWEDFARGLCLLDPYGLSVDYDVLKAVGATGTVEIFFNFMLVSANRNVLWTDPARVPRSRWPILTRVWGDESWRTELYEPQQQDLFGSTERKVSNARVVAKYRERLLAAGFKYVAQPIPMRNSQGAAIYYLFFASPNRTGAEHRRRHLQQVPITRRSRRQFNPASTIEQSLLAASLRGMAAELLEKERDTGRRTLIAQIFEPRRRRRPRAWLTLAARNQPMDALQIQVRERRE